MLIFFCLEVSETSGAKPLEIKTGNKAQVPNTGSLANKRNDVCFSEVPCKVKKIGNNVRYNFVVR